MIRVLSNKCRVVCVLVGFAPTLTIATFRSILDNIALDHGVGLSYGRRHRKTAMVSELIRGQRTQPSSC